MVKFCGKCGKPSEQGKLCTCIPLRNEEPEVLTLEETRQLEVLTLEEYCKILSGCLKRTDKNICIHRLTGDGDKRILIAPLWSGNKKNVLNSINRYLETTNTIQGELNVEKGR